MYSEHKQKMEQIFNQRLSCESGFFSEDLYQGKMPTQVKECSVEGSNIFLTSYKSGNNEQLRQMPQIGKNDGSRKKVLNTFQFPYSTIGLVQGELDNAYFFGTGCLIAPNIILTCAHNCFRRKSGSYTQKLAFIPALNGKNEEPLPVIKAYFPNQYKKSKEDYFNYDYAILLLKNDLSAEYGYLGIDTSEKNISQEKYYEICGYSKDNIEEEKKTQWKSAGLVFKNSQKQLQYKMSTFVGQGGSPIFYKKDSNIYIVGVHIGAKAKKEVNIGVCLTAQVRKQISEWIGLRLDLQLLNLQDGDIEYLADEKWSKKLASLSLIANPITNVGIRKLVTIKWEKLTKLDLSFNQFGDEGIRHLGNFENLKELALRDCQLTGNAVKLLSTCDFAFLQKLDLSENEIEDEDILLLTKFQTLKNLNLKKTKTTPEGIQQLRNRFEGKISILAGYQN